MGLREENVERRRQQILAAARELIVRGGIGSLSMRKIASEANVSVPTLYNLFGSKEEIRVAMSDGFFDGLDTALDGDLSSGQPLDRLFALVEASVDHVVNQADLTRPVLLAQEQGRGMERRTTPFTIERYRAAIQASIDEKHLRPDLRSDLLAIQAFEGFHRAALHWAGRDYDDAEFHARSLYSMSLCLLAVATDESRPALIETARDLETRLTA